jgi:tRNA (mo5U34)-methyltransferase
VFTPSSSLQALAPFSSRGRCDLPQLETILASELKRLTKGREHYQQLLSKLPEITAQTDNCSYSLPEVTVGREQELTLQQHSQLKDTLTKLIPWRKGPFSIMGHMIDAEWRSDQKWDRIKDAIGDLRGKTVLDIGCGNGYFMFRMLEKNPALVLGIDPVWHCHAQFHLVNHFAPDNQLHHHMLGIDHLPHFNQMFDTILSMGIVYHHRHPIMQLMDIYQALKPGGELVLESIGIPGEESNALFPPDRYAKMGNVWFIPTASCMVNWLKRSKFKQVEIISDTLLTPKEQRLTKWCPPPHQSLTDFLDPDDPNKTIEGHPAPRRFAIFAKKKR